MLARRLASRSTTASPATSRRASRCISAAMTGVHGDTPDRQGRAVPHLGGGEFTTDGDEATPAQFKRLMKKLNLARATPGGAVRSRRPSFFATNS